MKIAISFVVAALVTLISPQFASAASRTRVAYVTMSESGRVPAERQIPFYFIGVGF